MSQQSSGGEVEQGGSGIGQEQRKFTADELRAMLAEAEGSAQGQGEGEVSGQGAGAGQGEGEVSAQPALAAEDPFPGATATFEIPCDEVLRAGRGTTVAMRLGEPCAILGVVLAEGFALVGLKLAGKMFDEPMCAAKAYAGITVLGAQDNLELFVRNVSQEDRQFEGILVLGPHKVVGLKRPLYSGLMAPGADAQPLRSASPDALEGADPTLVMRGRRPNALAPVPRQNTPGQAAPMPFQYGGRSGPWASPPPPDRSVPVRRPGSPPIHRGGGMIEGKAVTPGPNEVAICVTREQAAKLYQIVVLGQYLPPFAKVDLQLPLERALS